MESLTDKQFQVLVKEFEILNSTIKDFNTKVFQIKGWSITIFSATIGLSIVNNKPILLLIPLISSFLFWGMEGVYKKFQKIMIDRVIEVEKTFNNEKLTINIGHLNHSFHKSPPRSFLQKINSNLDRMFTFNVYILYLTQIIILLLIALSFTQFTHS